MPTLAQLKATCAAYHQKDVADLTVNGIDLFLDAANDVRRTAELLNNFEASRVRATLSVDGVNGGSLADAVIVTPGFQWGGLKEVVTVSTSTAEGYDYPLPFARRNVVAEDERQMNNLDYNAYNFRYPSDSALFTGRTNVSIVQVGMSLFRYPSSAADSTLVNPLFLEGYALVADYTTDTLADDDYTDYFLTYGREWLKWAIIAELNYRYQTFVPRNEGVLSPPEQKRQEAWRSFLLWDQYQIDPNSAQ